MKFLPAVSVLSILFSSTLLASNFGDAELGKLKSPSCVFCHNPNGSTSQPSYPDLNGQDPLYLYNAMRAYINDERSGPMAALMKAQLQNLSDEDLKDVAAFYSEQ
ncbi:cytochrome c553 [Vibrio variabilis]|uniref:Cytochrome c553 n=1 Tax=Vibrio variabilis TaxID=990271 RepID=A0ABQ0JEC3_9VIBR|nr:cytochrome c553 [Vibrio variabilis]